MKNKSSYAVNNTLLGSKSIWWLTLCLCAYVFRIVHALLIRQISPWIRKFNYIKTIWLSQDTKTFTVDLNIAGGFLGPGLKQ